MLKRKKSTSAIALGLCFALLCIYNNNITHAENLDEFAGGRGTEDNPYLVEDADQLDNVRRHLGKHFRQISDINLKSYSEDKGWEPMGRFESIDDYDGLTGSFDGNGYKITNLTIKRPEAAGVGLFVAACKKGEIRGVKLKKADVTGSYGVGALAGGNEGLIADSHVMGNVKGEEYTGIIVGGNMGRIKACYAYGNAAGKEKTGGAVGGSDAEIIKTFFTGTVEGREYTGGIVGGNEGLVAQCSSEADAEGQKFTGALAGGNAGRIKNSCSKGNLRGQKYSGGLAGGNEGEVFRCRSKTEVEGLKEFTGGLVGGNEGKILKSHAEAQVAGNEFTGGLVGGSEGTIRYCYATGNATGKDAVAGLAGGNTGDILFSYASVEVKGEDRTAGLVARNFFGNVQNSYYDKEVANQEDETGGSVPVKTKEMMRRDTFEGWDFERIWDIDEKESYPFLRLENEKKRSGQ